MNYVCNECGWRGKSEDLLIQLNPFISEETITVCPKCCTLNNTVRLVCEYPECKKEASCGTPTKNGYKQVCGQHFELLQGEKECIE